MPKIVRRLQKSESNIYCCVPQCSSWLKKDRLVSFHKFPEDAALKQLWQSNLKMGKKPSMYMKVCSKHFKHEDYFLPGG